MALRVWLPLTGSLENKGISNVTITNNGATVDNNGKIGKCYNLTNGPITVSQLSNSKNISVAFWFKRTANTGTRQFMFTAWNGVTCELTTDGAPTFAVYRNNYPTIYGSPITTSSGWIHYCGTFSEKEGLKLYINGSLVAQNNITTPIAWSTISGQIGKYDSYASMSALMNDFRIYDHALSAKEVKEISQGLVLHYKLDKIYPKEENNLVVSLGAGGQTTISNNMVTTSGTNADTYFQLNLSENIVANTTYTISCYADGLNNNSYWCFPLGRQSNTSLSFYIYNGYNVYTFTANDISWGTKRIFLDDTASSARSLGTPTRMWDFKVSKNSYVKDSSGYENDGNVLNLITTESNTSPRYNANLHIGATNAKIKISNLTTTGFANSYSFAWWAKISSVDPMHWGFSDGIRLNGLYTGRLWNTGDGSNNPLYNPGTTTQVTAPSVNTWHHWVMTGDGSKCRVYQDGVLWAEAKTYKAISGTTIYINGWDTGTGYSSTNYSISDFRIYATALSADDVKALYQIPTSIDNLGNLHTFEVEENEDRNISVLKNGIVSAPLPMEYMYLNDGSVWMPIMYHNNKAHTNLFSSSDDFAKFVQHNIDCWADFSLISAVTRPDTSKYEFLVVQQDLHADTFKSFRWSQTSNPITTTSVSGFAAITTGVTHTPAGGLCKCSGATYLAISNSTSNWWQACGCWTAYNDGIPGFGSISPNGVIALYIRVSKEIYTQFKSWLLLGNQLIEE